MSLGLTFPQNPIDGQTVTRTFTHTGGDAGSSVMTRTWSWDQRRGAWVSNGSNSGNGGGGGIGSQGFQGLQGFQGNTGSTGLQGFQGFQGNTGSTGLQGFQGITGPGGVPQGPDYSIQFKDGSSLSGLATATIVTDNNILNPSGFSGNFLYYTESTTSNSNKISTTQTITIPFGTRNSYTIDNIALNEGVTLTIDGLTTSYTGASMTLVLGHTGASGSTILFPGSMGIYWSDGGPFGVTNGTNAKIYPRATKKFDVLYFFTDGTYMFGNLLNAFRQSR